MYYLTIPLAILLAAVLAIAVIVWRKWPYLRKLTPEAHEVGDTVLHDFAPEAVDWWRRLPRQQYWSALLAGIEQGLAAVRGALFSLGKASDTAVKHVRRAGQSAAREHEKAVAQIAREEEAAEKEERDPDEIDMDDPDQVKQEEQRLIVAIAQNPKDPALYSDLARVAMRLGAYADAVEALEQAIKLTPEEHREPLEKRLERAKRKQEESEKLPTTAEAAK